MERGLSDYERTLAALFARTGTTSKFGLERTAALLSLLNSPHKRIETIHVAGTNGKGSVVATIYALLRAKGLRVGRYTSPHLVDFSERIVVDDVQIAADQILAFLSRWESDTERLGATFFEITTALAFDHFATAGVDIAIIETGLGGRLDSTNVVTPLVAGVTSISIDHSEYLGDTIQEIAAEKAGIFKRGVPAVIGPMSAEAGEVMVRIAGDVAASSIVQAVDRYTPLGVTVSTSGTDFDVVYDGTATRVRSGLTGVEQATNSCIALAMLRAAGPAYQTSVSEAAVTLPTVRLRGRFERVGNLIFDVAHNPASMQALARTLKSVNPPRPLVAVLGVLKDKDWRAMIEILAGVADHIILTAPSSAPLNRSWDVREAVAFAGSLDCSASLESDVDVAIARGLAIAETVVITGSFHTVGDGLKSLGLMSSP